MTPSQLKRAFAILASCLLPAIGRAQSVHWEPPGGTMAVGETTSLQLVFEDCAPKGTPAPPKADGLRIEYAGQSSQFSMVNGSTSQSVTLNYAALLNRKESVDLPSFEVETSKGRVTVAAAHFEPTEATVGSTGTPLESAASSQFQAPPGSVWAGEVFGLGYSIEAGRSYQPDFGQGAVEWNPDPLVAEDWSKPGAFDDRSGDEPRMGLAYKTRALLRAPGTYRLRPASQIVNLSVGVSGLGFFQQRQFQQFSVTSNTPQIEVLPLPPAPAGFSGAVGHFKLLSKVVPASAAVGEPITWTLKLSGTGNWPDIAGLPPRKVSEDFRVIQPRAKRTIAPGKVFDATLEEDAVLMPTKPGTYTLDSVTFIAFDPRSGTYQTLTTPAATVTVTAAARGAPSQAQAPVLPAAAGGPPPTARPEVPTTPSGLPRDALDSASPAPTPLSGAVWAALTVISFVLPLAVWMALAIRRARQSDPLRARREAKRRLADTVARMREGSGALLPHLLRSWQADAAAFWGIVHAAPSAHELSAMPAWSDLWAEADRALYGPEAALPPDWTARAQAALADGSIPGFRLARFLLPQNLLPWFFCAAALLGVTSFGAESPAAAYRRGDFAAAERAARSAVASNPTDWSARHNLSLALAQQNRWDEAAAQAAVALVQQPGDPAVRWQFALACEKAGFAPAPLDEFISPGPVEWLAGWASPAAWQRILVAAAWVGSGSLCILLLCAYGVARSRWVMRCALIVFGLAALSAAGAYASWRAYGPSADSRAVVIWRNGTLRSIPSEVESGQKTAPLPAGSLAIADKNFLGWVRLAFDNGQTGWVRRDEVIWLWR